MDFKSELEHLLQKYIDLPLTEELELEIQKQIRELVIKHTKGIDE